MPAHILLVEDEENLRETLALNLRLEGYTITATASGRTALQQISGQTPDLALLDVMLPDMDGFSLCEALKNNVPGLPVIFLTARGQASDKKTGLRLGADDYITKPFDLEELLLRVSNLLKRTQPEKEETFVFRHGAINFETFEITDLQSNRHTLSKKEIGLLKLLAQYEGRVLSRDKIIDALWEPDENASTRTIDNLILNFRKYFEPDPKVPVHFISVRGVGYKFVA